MKAYFAGGCFWCITPVFRELTGVLGVVSGYCGGHEADPSYEDVKSQITGHRETLEITYDASKLDFDKLMRIYLANVDPYDSGGQFIDRGHSYTLAVYYTDDHQRDISVTMIAELEAKSGKKVCIAVERFEVFYPAEEYHQDYDLKNPEAFRRELVESGRVKES